MNTKKLIKELDAHKKSIGNTRDKLRDTMSEFKELENVCDRAFEDITSAIEALSEFVQAKEGQMQTKNILIEYLKTNGFDGLYSPGECSCEVDDLGPCGQVCLECESGYKTDCSGCLQNDVCPYGYEQDGFDFCIGPKRQAKEV